MLEFFSEFEHLCILINEEYYRLKFPKILFQTEQKEMTKIKLHCLFRIDRMSSIKPHLEGHLPKLRCKISIEQ